MLIPGHNYQTAGGHVRLSCDFTFGRYFNMTSLLYRAPARGYISSLLSSLLVTVRRGRGTIELHDGTYLSTRGLVPLGGANSSVVDSYVEASLAARRGTPFIWTIGESYWRWAEAMSRHQAQLGSTHCERLPRVVCGGGYSPTVVSLREQLLGQLGLRDRPFVTLHVRRGDVASKCPTEVDDVVRYVACSENRSANVGAVPLLLFTDERAPSYLQALLARLAHLRTGYRGGGGPVMHGDALVEALISRDGGGPAGTAAGDNFLVYAVSSAVKERAMGWLTRRWANGCPQCDDAVAKRRQFLNRPHCLPSRR